MDLPSFTDIIFGNGFFRDFGDAGHAQGTGVQLKILVIG